MQAEEDAEELSAGNWCSKRNAFAWSHEVSINRPAHCIRKPLVWHIRDSIRALESNGAFVAHGALKHDERLFHCKRFGRTKRTITHSFYDPLQKSHFHVWRIPLLLIHIGEERHGGEVLRKPYDLRRVLFSHAEDRC